MVGMAGEWDPGRQRPRVGAQRHQGRRSRRVLQSLPSNYSVWVPAANQTVLCAAQRVPPASCCIAQTLSRLYPAPHRSRAPPQSLTARIGPLDSRESYLPVSCRCKPALPRANYDLANGSTVSMLPCCIRDYCTGTVKCITTYRHHPVLKALNAGNYPKPQTLTLTLT